MNWAIKLSSKAEKYYSKLNKDMRERIKKELLHLYNYNSPVEHPNVKPLTGELKGFYILRVGDYRIVFALLKETQTIAVVNIAPRSDVYK